MTVDTELKMKKEKWLIYISGYGTFFFDGTRKEAEEMRRHKANWEGGVGRKRLATDADINDMPRRIERKEAIKN